MQRSLNYRTRETNESTEICQTSEKQSTCNFWQAQEAIMLINSSEQATIVVSSSSKWEVTMHIPLQIQMKGTNKMRAEVSPKFHVSSSIEQAIWWSYSSSKIRKCIMFIDVCIRKISHSLTQTHLYISLQLHQSVSCSTISNPFPRPYLQHWRTMISKVVLTSSCSSPTCRLPHSCRRQWQTQPAKSQPAGEGLEGIQTARRSAESSCRAAAAEEPRSLLPWPQLADSQKMRMNSAFSGCEACISVTFAFDP